MNYISIRNQIEISETPTKFTFIIHETPEGRFLAWSENNLVDWLPTARHFLITSTKWNPGDTYFGKLENGFWFTAGEVWKEDLGRHAGACDDDGIRIEFKAFRQLSTREIYLLATGKLNIKELPYVKE